LAVLINSFERSAADADEVMLTVTEAGGLQIEAGVELKRKNPVEHMSGCCYSG
jgi:hypothetical protein